MDRAREKKSLKRGGDRQRCELDQIDIEADRTPDAAGRLVGTLVPLRWSERVVNATGFLQSQENSLLDWFYTPIQNTYRTSAVLGWFASDSGVTVPAAALPLVLPLMVVILSSLPAEDEGRAAPGRPATTAPSYSASRRAGA